MITLTTLRRFHDTTIQGTREVGDVFDVTEERAARIMAALPGYVAVVEPPVEDLSKKTVAQLRAICAERGIEVPKGAKKAYVLRLLEA